MNWATGPGGSRAGEGLRVAVIGATGNAGTSTLRLLSDDERIGSVLAVARRVPQWTPPKIEWHGVDISRDVDLVPLLRGVDVVVHLAWLFQPTRHPAVTWRTNVLGSMRVFQAAADAGVGSVIYQSSVGAYSPGYKDRLVDESWPTDGWPEAAYCREKAYVERYLDNFERRYPWVRVVRLRPGFLFKEESAAQQRRLFAGPFLPARLVRTERVPVVPDVPGMRVQALHSDDAAQAIRLAVTGTVRGPFNLAAEPVIDAGVLAELLGARTVRTPLPVVRAAVASAYHARVVPASPQLFDAALRMPLLDTTRAHEDLQWFPRWTAAEAVGEFLKGLRQGSGMDTPPLVSRLPGGGRLRELATGVGRRA